ncbi:MAG: hypothetical protein AVDCRST_MAG69-2830, partial [uncultured Solirubrobacteraceae bacterium]
AAGRRPPPRAPRRPPAVPLRLRRKPQHQGAAAGASRETPVEHRRLASGQRHPIRRSRTRSRTRSCRRGRWEPCRWRLGRPDSVYGALGRVAGSAGCPRQSAGRHEAPRRGRFTRTPAGGRMADEQATRRRPSV